MAKLNKQQVQARAKEIIRCNPGGIRYSEIVAQITAADPETPTNSVNGWVWNLDALFPNEVAKPTRGLFVPVNNALASNAEIHAVQVQDGAGGKRVRESDFYEPFAEWLSGDLDEVNAAIPLGGAGFKAKWGTPDVIGVYKPRAADRIKFGVEIVSAEIKIDPTASVVAFGQAAAYRLFSSKVYIAMPATISAEDLSRLESLCMLFGIGLAIFDLQKSRPAFRIRVRAQRFLPDMFFVNEFAERLSRLSPSEFQRLFG